MNSPLNDLFTRAQPCKPVRADLRNSTVTFDWPSNVLVRKADYIIVPANEVSDALVHTQRFSIGIDPQEDRAPYVRWDDYSSRYTAFRDGRLYNVYFEYPGEEKKNPRPFTWWGRVYFEDIDGVMWDSGLARLVVDCFGNLVDCRTGR